MAQFGAKCPMFAPFKTEPAAALPTYDTAVTVGALVSANLTVNLEIKGNQNIVVNAK